MRQKGFTPIFILVGILVLGMVAGGGYYFIKSKTPKPKACTEEAKICPDGSSVGRTGPNCEFVPCPLLTPAEPTNEPLTELPQTAERAKQDLIKNLGINESDIILENLEKTYWSDSSLGCPKEGRMYAQVITPGYRVVFSYLEKEYEYHTDNSRFFVQCEKQK